MSLYGSQKGLNMGRRAGSRGDLTGGMSQHYARSEVVHGGGNGYDQYMDGYNTYSFSKSSMGGMGGGMMGGMAGGGMGSVKMSGTGGGMMTTMTSGMGGGMGGGMSGSSAIHQRAMILQGQCQEYLKKAEYALQTGGASGDAERYMAMAKETIEHLKGCAMDLRQMGQPNDNVVRTLEICKDQLKGVHMAISGTMTRRRSTRGSSGGGWEEPGRSFQDAMGWIAQHKRLIETAPWGDDPAAIEQQLISHQKFHSSIQRCPEMDRARDDLIKKGDKGNLHALDQEWDSLQQMSFGRAQQLQELQQIIQEMSKEIMWVNSREEEELVFDWGDKNIDQYIPRKQESYSKLMSALEDKEKDLNKLKAKVDNLLKNNHPAEDKIEAYKDTLQTQWSWLLQITKCIDVHLKENAAYSQFFKEANETYSNLQKEHELVRKKFTCDKNTSLEDLVELLKGLEKEKEKIMENRRQVQHLVSSSKNIVRLKPRNPEEKSSSPVIVKALCDFKQDQKVICKGNEAILKDNSQRSKWEVTGPGGLDMTVPSVCLIVPPPNPLSISLASKNEQYYEAIMSIWNQLYINVKSLIAWQYCLLDIRHINSLTMSMLSKMRPEEYRQLIKSLETHFEEFKVSCQGSQMFAEEDKKTIENQFTGAQAHYDQLVVQLPTYIAQVEAQQVAEQQQEFIIIQQAPEQQRQQELIIIQQQQAAEQQRQQELIIIQQQQAAEQQRQQELLLIQQQQQAAAAAAARAEARRLEEERRKAELKKLAAKKEVLKREVVKVTETEPVRRKVVVPNSSASSAAVSTSHSLSELHALRLRLEAAEGTLSQHVHICLGDDGVHDCGLKIVELEAVQRDIDTMRTEYLRLREIILKELDGMNDSDKAQFLRSEIGIINQRLGSLESSSSAYLHRLRALRDMLESVARAEDLVKVHEARLTEKETTSLSPSEVEDYILTLTNIKAELEQKKKILASMEAELAKASHWNSQVGGPFHRCDMMLSKYTEEVGLLSDRWRRIIGQIDTRLQDLHVYQPQLQRYKETSSSLIGWIDATRKKQDALQATKIESIQALKEHIDNQKALNSEIKSKREHVESVLKDNEACVNSIKDYETDLACYMSGLETLLNIPIKRTMLKSPSMDLNLEATQIQTRYMELLTLSGDYYKFLGQLYKNMEELKMSNTRIDLLEEELRLLREGIQDRDSKNRSLEDSVARYQLELSQSQDQLLSMEEVKQSAALQCSATKDSLDSTQSQLAELNDEVTRLNYLLEEEKRKRRLAEERYTQQQEEYDLVLRKRQKELETVSWSKVDVEKSVASKDHEIEQLRRQLADDSARIKELQKDMSKVRSQCSTEISNLKLSYESQIHASRSDIQRLAAQRDDDTAELQLQYDRMMAERRNLEDELRRLRMSIAEVEEQRQRVEEEAHSQRAVITEEGRRRRELESQVEVLMRQRDEESRHYSEELAEVMKSLDEKREELAYITHSLEEETRRRRTTEEGQGVLEQTLAQMQVKVTNSSIAANQLGECKEELQKTCLELERASRESSRLEQNMSRLQGRMKDLQAVRDGLESQVENLRKANQEEVARRRQAETELEKTTIAMTEYSSTITSLHQSQDQASMLEKRGEEERLRLQGELERSLRKNKSSAESMTQLNAELKAVQQQLLQEQARVQEANLRNESLHRTTEERSQALNENTAELKRLKEMTEAQTKERLRLEEKLQAAQRVEEEHLRLQGELERSLRQNKSSTENMTQLNAELKAVQQQLLQEQARVQEANLRNESLHRTTEERSQALNENTAELKRLKEMTEAQTKERLRLEEKLQAAQRVEAERLRLQEELERSLRQNKSSVEGMTQLRAELKAVQQQLLQEQARVQEANLRNESLCRTTEERSKVLNENTAELKRMKEMTETQTKERLMLEKELQAAQRSEKERLRLQEELERSLRQNKSTVEGMTQLSVELKALKQQLLQEQARVKEANLRNESLYKTIEERSKALNENTAELQRLKEMTETQTKERLRLEEELRAARHDKEELLRSKQECDDELSSQISALELQLKASERSNIDYRNLVSELSSEREKLKLETEKIQNQATETTAMMQSIQSQYNDIVSERDALLLKLQLSDKDKDRLKRLEEELSNIKLSLESELRNKQRLQDEIERVKRDLSYWKDQYESKQGQIRQYDTDKERLEREKNSLKSEIERLMRELRELEETYKSKLAALQKELREMTIVRQSMETELKRAREPPTLDASTVVFDGVRKSVTADKLLDCGVLDKPTFSQLVKGHKTVPEVSADKKINLKGTGPIAGVVIEGPKGPGSATGPICKMTFAEAKRENLLPPDSVDLLLDAQAATGHIIDPRTNQKLTVEEACNQGVVDEEDKERLLAAEAAAVGYSGPGTSQPLSVFQAMKKGLTDRNTTLRLLQAQESVGGILDPKLSVFLPKNTAMERKLIDDDISRALSQRPELYLDPESEEGVTYMSMKRRCKVEPHTGLLLLPVAEKVDPSKLVFDGVRKPVTAKQLVDCGVLDKPTFKDLEKGKKTVPEVSVDKNVNLKGTGPIAGVVAGSQGKMSLSEAKKKMLLPEEAADLLLEAQAATGHIIDPRTNQKLTVQEACGKGVVEISDRDKLLAAEAAAVGYKDLSAAKPLSVFEAMKKGLIDRDTGLRLLQAQESVGGILDPNLSVFLPKDTAIKRKILDENLRKALNQSPECYLDPETENDVTYGALKKRCKTEPHTGLLLLPITERKDPSKLVFDGVRKPVTAQQLLDCGVLDKPTFNQLMKGEKTVPEVSVDKKVPLKGTGSIAGVAAGPLGKMSLSEAKKQMVMPPDSADLLLEAQAATGHIIDPTNNQKLTVEEACARGVVDTRDRDKLLAAEAAAVGYRDPSTGKPISVFEAMKKGIIDRKAGLRLLQAQESAGGILDPNLSVFLPKETAIKRNLLDDELSRALNSRPDCYLDPDTERDTNYGALKKRCKTESHTGLILLPITERKDPSKLIFDGVRKPVTAQELLDCGVLDKPTFNQLVKGEKTVPEVSVDKKVSLKGTGSIAGVAAGPLGKMSLSEAKKQMVMPPDSADLLLEAQAATGHIIDPTNNQKLTVEEACAKGVVDTRDRDRLLAAEAAAVGYRDFSTGKPISVFEAMKKGIIDRKTGLRLLQAQESAGGILDPNLSVFLPKETAIKRNLLDEELSRALNSRPDCYLDPDTECDTSYGALKKRCKTESHTGLILLPITERKDPSKLIFDGVRKPVTAQELLDCGVLDKPTFNQLVKGEKTVPEVSVDKKVYLKGTGSIAGVAAGPLGKMSLSEAKKQMIMPPDSADLLLEAQAATGHIIDPTKNQKLTVEEACARGVVDTRDRDRLLAAEAAAVGYRDPSTAKPISVFEAMKKGIIDRKTGLSLLQAQESAGGILDPNLSVFLPKETAIKRNLLDEELSRALNSRPDCYLDPDIERDTSYGALKKRCKTESHTGLILLPITERKDPSKLIFDGVRKPVSAQELLDCGVLDKPTFDQLVRGEKTVPEVSVDKKVFLKGTGSIGGVVAGRQGKMSLSEAKNQMVMPPDSADLLLEAQAATGHITDLTKNQKLTVEEACARGVVNKSDRDRLLTAEAAAVGYRDPSTGKPISVFEAMRKGIIDRKTGLRLLQAQESAGGILDPNLSVFLPKETAIKHNLLDEELSHALNSKPECYIDPDTERDTSYGALKKRCKTESHTGLILLPITERKDPSKLIFDGVRKPVSAQELFECGVLDKPTFDQLVKGDKTVLTVSGEKKVYLKGTGPIAGVVAGRQGKMSLSEAKKQKLLSEESANLLLEAQAATGHIIDPKTNQRLTVEEASARGFVDLRDRDRLLAAEAAAVGYKDRSAAKPLSVFEAMKKGLIDRKTGLRLLQAQESMGGILDPSLSVFLPKDTAIKRNLLDENLCHALKQSPASYLDPETENDISYGALKERCMTETHTGLQLLPVSERFDPSKLMLDGVRKPVSAQQLFEYGVLDKPTFDQLVKGEKTVPEVSVDKKVFLKGTGSIGGVAAGPLGKMSFTEAKKQKIMSSDSADMLLVAQAATGHIIDPRTNQKLTVKEACARGVVDKKDESKLFAAEAAVIGYKDPNTTKLLSAGQAMKRGLIDKDTALRILQAQQSVGGILDPNLSVFLPKDIAMDRGLIDEELHQALNQCPECYLDPDTQQATTYLSIQKKCKADPSTGLMLLPEPEKPLTVQGLRGQVSVIDLVDANLLERSDMNRLREGRLTSQDIENRLRPYLRGSTCIAGVYDEAGKKMMPIYQAMKEELLLPGTTLELLEAQAASGFIVDPVNNVYLSVSDAYNKRLFGPEFKDNLLSAERAVTGYKVPGTDKVISLFQAIERGLIEKGHGIRLLEAQIASGGIIDPEHGHRIDVNVAYRRGYFDEKMNKILTDQSVDSKGFFDPNTEENLTYLELKKRCITDKKTGLILLPIMDKKKKEATLKNTLRKRRVVIVDPETNREMTVRQAYDRGLIDYDTYVELSEQECEWEEITITDPDGSTRFLIIDKKTGRQYDITELLENKIIDQSDLDKYRSRTITLTQFADIIANKTKYGSSFSSSSTSKPSAASGTSYSVTSSITSKTSAAPGTSSVASSTLTSRTPAASGASSMTSSGAATATTLRPSAASGTSSMTSSSSTSKTSGSLGVSSSSSSSSVLSRPLSPTLAKTTTTRTTMITERSGTMSSVSRDSPDSLRSISSVSITLASPVETMGEQEPVGAIFDTETLEKISITEALNRGLVDSITAQRLLEAQACSGGIVNPTNGQRLGIQEACRLGIIDDDMASRLKPAQKAYIGFEDVKTRRKISAAEAVKEMWLPYEAGQRFMEFQYVTGGLYDPEMGCRRTIQDALKMGWIDERTAQRLQDISHHTKNLTCPKSKLKISYKDALDNCLAEERTGVRMLQASSVSSRGISSPYNVSSAPGSTTGSRSGSRRSSRRSSVDLGSPSASSTSRYSHTFFSSFSSTSAK